MYKRQNRLLTLVNISENKYKWTKMIYINLEGYNWSK